jgi:hypothetical protein
LCVSVESEDALANLGSDAGREPVSEPTSTNPARASTFADPPL